MSQWFLNGLFEAGCHCPTCFSTYHHIDGGICAWCHRTEAELMALGAKWVDVLGRERDAEGTET